MSVCRVAVHVRYNAKLLSHVPLPCRCFHGECHCFLNDPPAATRQTAEGPRSVSRGSWEPAGDRGSGPLSSEAHRTLHPRLPAPCRPRWLPAVPRPGPAR
ncbi:hypothetical protein AAFF_G00201470 [Aldrovandia affinis]|uniref:Uncharacterized protein n=1 Tax=Aldrovandia affinis TaxID=143900 RepID=A0AAD7SYQ8_9TELE|nr:hypothetical protein AAFF_G00201470 [Aldrovandia affinis]